MSEKILYLECNSGISGDMTVAALLDLGANEQVLRAALASLPLEGYAVVISRVKKSGLDVLDFDVVLEHENHDHDMAYLYGQDRSQSGEAIHTHGPTHHHRTPADIYEIIDQGKLTQGAAKLAHRIFEILAQAEATAHGVSVSEVHFHEVGAVDSIVDIVAAAVCLDNLAPDRVVVSPLSEGKGQVRCQHGLLPIPVPAVTNIVMEHQIPMKKLDVEGELVTPTGAAIVAAIRQENNLLPEQYRICGIGMGAGKREYGLAGFLRAMWIEE